MSPSIAEHRVASRQMQADQLLGSDDTQGLQCATQRQWTFAGGGHIPRLGQVGAADELGQQTHCDAILRVYQQHDVQQETV